MATDLYIDENAEIKAELFGKDKVRLEAGEDSIYMTVEQYNELVRRGEL